MLNRAFASAAMFAALALDISPARADEILITQAKALAGNVTPGDAAGFPVTLSLPGKYRLTTNIYPTAGETGIRVAQRNITIDLDGFELHGANIAAHGITGLQPGTTIENGTVTGFVFDGINGAGPDWIVEGVRIVGNGRFGVSLTGTYSTVRGSTVTKNESTGILCGARCLIENNTASGNGAAGINTGSGTVLGNTIIGNTGFGILGVATTGYGNNTLSLNNSGADQVNNAAQLHPNLCAPACP